MNKCRKCKNMFEATQHQIKKRDLLCLPCRRVKDKLWRDYRKKIGKPVISKKMPSEYHKEYAVEYNKKPAVKKRRAELQRKYRKDPEQRTKHAVRWLTNRAINSGKLQRLPCEVCGEKKVDAHHDDYSKPLDVRWLCRKHHAEHHTKAEGK